METDDIEKLFLRVLANPEQDTDAVRKVFSILVQTTLEYRDRILASKGIVVTVEHVRRSLDLLVLALSTGNAPDMDSEISSGLLNVWLRKLKQLS